MQGLQGLHDHTDERTSLHRLRKQSSPVQTHPKIILRIITKSHIIPFNFLMKSLVNPQKNKFFKKILMLIPSFQLKILLNSFQLKIY